MQHMCSQPVCGILLSCRASSVTLKKKKNWRGHPPPPFGGEGPERQKEKNRKRSTIEEVWTISQQWGPIAHREINQFSRCEVSKSLWWQLSVSKKVPLQIPKKLGIATEEQIAPAIRDLWPGSSSRIHCQFSGIFSLKSILNTHTKKSEGTISQCPLVFTSYYGQIKEFCSQNHVC